MNEKQVIDKVRSYTRKYETDTKKWTLAVKFQLLFEILPSVSMLREIDSGCVSIIEQVTSELASIENSGIVRISCKVKDKTWEDSCVSKYTCGRYVLEFTEHTQYKRDYLDTDWYLQVMLKDVISEV